jgi:hypothetical protein
MATNKPFFYNPGSGGGFNINVKQLKLTNVTDANLVFLDSTGETVSKNIDANDLQNGIITFEKFDFANVVATGSQGLNGDTGSYGFVCNQGPNGID